jgi:hypothetical protein
MALLKIKLDGELFEVEKLTLGEGRILKRDYGMSDLSEINLADPDQLVGMLSISMKRTHPELSEEEVLAKVEGLDFLTIENLGDDGVDPPRVVADAGKSATTRKTSGTRS